MKIDFNPYSIYLKNLKQIDEFSDLTNLSYGLAQQLLFKYPSTKLDPIILEKEDLKIASYSMADILLAEPKQICTWISFEEYARKSGKSIEIIESLALDGQLGIVQKHPKHGHNILIWPPEFKDKKMEDLPKPGQSKYKVQFQVDSRVSLDLDTEDTNNFDNIRNKFLYLAHSIGNSNEVTARANELLCKSSLILHWTAFEVYLKSTIYELFRLNPSILMNNKEFGRREINYKRIFDLSSGFSNIQELRDSLVELEIQRQESEGKSVHGLINFLKSKFKFKQDPYEGWYVFRGVRYTTHYNDLLEIKEVRNALIHDSGSPEAIFFTNYPNVPNREGNIVIDEDYYLKCDLILRTIAFNIAKSVSNNEYAVDTK